MKNNIKLLYLVSIVLCICLVCLGIRYYNSDDVKFNRYFDKITNIKLEEVTAIDVPINEVVAGEPESSPGLRKDFYIMTASNAPHGCEYGTDRGRQMDTEQMLEELDKLSGFIFNEYLIRGSVIYRDKLLDGKHLVFHFLDEKPENIEVYYIVGDAIEQEYRLYEYPFKIPEEPGIYNFFVQLTWSSGDRETVFFRVTVEEDRGGEWPPTAEELEINYNRFEPLGNCILKTLFKYDPEIIKGDPDKLGEPYMVQGKYDLNSDGLADIIEVSFKALSALIAGEQTNLRK